MGASIYAGRAKVVFNQQNKNISTRTNLELLLFSPELLIGVANLVVFVTRTKWLIRKKD